jgi:hypothetical protein
MSPTEKPTLAAYWADTRTILSYSERMTVLPNVHFESITPTEVLAREVKTNRLIIISSVEEDEIFCDVCDKERTARHTYNRVCPRFASCIADNPLDPNGGKPQIRNGESEKG